MGTYDQLFEQKKKEPLLKKETAPVVEKKPEKKALKPVKKMVEPPKIKPPEKQKPKKKPVSRKKSDTVHQGFTIPKHLLTELKRMKLDAEDIGEKTSVKALVIEALEEYIKKSK